MSVVTKTGDNGSSTFFSADGASLIRAPKTGFTLYPFHHFFALRSNASLTSKAFCFCLTVTADLCFDVVGTLDELNASIGLAVATIEQSTAQTAKVRAVLAHLSELQKILFGLGSAFCVSEQAAASQSFHLLSSPAYR